MLRAALGRARRVRERLALSEIVVLGDSHARVFRHWWFAVFFPLTRFRVCVVGGATASGLENPNSKTQAYQTFRLELARSAGKPIVCLLGEVDTGFVIWLRAERDRAPVEQMLRLAVDTYCRFLCEARKVASRLVVVSAPLPTIGDGAPLGEIANLRKEVKATLAERTELTRAFNGLLAARCAEIDVGFIDLDRASAGRDALVRPGLLNSDPTDHHFALEPYARMLAPRLRQRLLI